LAKESQNGEIYVGELEENGTRMKPPKRLTFDDHYDAPSAWTPDSKAVLFSSDRKATQISSNKRWISAWQNRSLRAQEMSLIPL
jgi:hypothetical protein